MGMFDNIVPHIELPEECGSVDEWQTKDTYEMALTTYDLRADGTLWARRWHTEVKPGAPPKPDDFMEYMLRWRKEWEFRVYDPPEQEIHNGSVEFYGHSQNGDWHNVIAFFEDGVCFKTKHIVERHHTIKEVE